MNKKMLLLLMGLVVITCYSCKKFVDKQKENYVLGIMTEGRWYLQNYTEQGLDNTADFRELEFQFYKNNTIDAIDTTTALVRNGSWSADVNNISMSVNFPSTGDKLKRLNYIWKITDAYTNAVFAEASNATGLITIKLYKK